MGAFWQALRLVRGQGRRKTGRNWLNYWQFVVNTPS